MKSLARTLFAIITCYIAGIIAALFVGHNTLAWYTHLVKPSVTPSNWVFLVVWIVLYGLIGLALGRTWSKHEMWNSWTGLFYVSLAFNIAWVMFFFGFHTIFLALIDVGCLSILLIMLTLSAWEIDHIGTYLLTPYLAWVLFALYLNTQIWLLN